MATFSESIDVASLSPACIAAQATCDASLADFDRNGTIDVIDETIYAAARDSGTLSALGCTRRLGSATP